MALTTSHIGQPRLRPVLDGGGNSGPESLPLADFKSLLNRIETASQRGTDGDSGDRVAASCRQSRPPRACGPTLLP
jgi:hypothetical protein